MPPRHRDDILRRPVLRKGQRVTRPIYLSPEQAETRGPFGHVRRRLKWWHDRIGQGLTEAGLPPHLQGGRWVRHEAAAERALQVGHAEEIHPPRIVPAPLPVTASARDDLSDDQGWFGFSFREVPERQAGPTRILTLPDCRVLAGQTPTGDFSPAILSARGWSLDMREIRYRSFHARLAQRRPDLVMERAVWIAERVFDNHSHWFTAHLAKLVLLRDRGETENLVLPAQRSPAIDCSLRRIGIAPENCIELPRDAVLGAAELVVVESDRFRPELLTAARAAIADPPQSRGRRIFISRRTARGRRILNEEALYPLLDRFGFESVAMEQLDLPEQVAMMSEAETLLAPHGAGLTNMLFCPTGTRILEIADPEYPNPNFYAMAAALGHVYGHIPAQGVGETHPLRQDLAVDVRALETALVATVGVGASL